VTRHGDPALDALRQQLAAIDREIVVLLSRRQRLASEIGHIKRAQGVATRNFSVEKDVIERARRLAQELGAPPALAEEVMGALIRASLELQERERRIAGGGGEGRRVLVIGGAGRMGRWLVRFLGSQGFRVEVADPFGVVEGATHRADWTDGALDQDLICVAAPLRESAGILDALAAHRPPGVVFDVGSLKTPLAPSLRRLAAAGVQVASMHPMFGPATELLAGRHVIFCDVGAPQATRALRALFESTMATAVDLDLEAHDRVIAYVLGLSHAVNIAFSAVLAQSGEAAPRLAEVSSTTFSAQLDIAGRVASENPHLYYEIQALNAFGPGVLDALADTTRQMAERVQRGDEAGFCALMEAGRSWFDARTQEVP
jgi:chorismate mutase/prephenate dehydrogenase